MNVVHYPTSPHMQHNPLTKIVDGLTKVHDGLNEMTNDTNDYRMFINFALFQTPNHNIS